MTSKPRLLLAIAALLALGSPIFAQEAVIDAGKAALVRGDGIAAEVELRRALQQGASRASLNAFLGEAALLQGDLAAARQWLGGTVFTADTAAHGFRMLGRLDQAEGDFRQAGFAFDKAIELDPQNAALWLDVARFRYASGAQVEAKTALAQALRFDPKLPGALLFAALLERDSRGPAQALPWFERAIAATQGDAELLYQAAATYGEVGDVGAMNATLERLAKSSPDETRGKWLTLVQALREGRMTAARRVAWQARDGREELPGTLLVEAVMDLEAGNAGLAAENLYQLLELQPDNLPALRILGRALIADGQYREAAARLGEREALIAGDPYGATIVARAYEHLGDRAEAARWLDRADGARSATLVPLGDATEVDYLARRHGDDPLMVDRAVAYVRALVAAGQGARAAEVTSGLVRAYPGSLDMLTLRGDALVAAEAYADAKAAYAQAESLRWSPSLAKRQAWLFARSGDRSAAAAMRERLKKAYPLLD